MRKPRRVVTNLTGYLAARWSWAAIILVLALSFFSWGLIGTNAWAGLGQWIGGAGAFFAALIALRISRFETDRRDKEQKHSQRVNAFGLQVNSSYVRNWTNETFRHVLITRGGNEGRGLVLIDNQYVATLLPYCQWNFAQHLPAELQLGGTVFEIQYEDMYGQAWKRIDADAPEEVNPAKKASVPPRDKWPDQTVKYKPPN